MSTTNTTTTAAVITKITANETATTVELEWGGLDDHFAHDFDLALLGKVITSSGGNLRVGWVFLDGPCLLKEGDAIPLADATTTNTMTTQEQQHIDREIRRAEKMLENEPRLGAAELAIVTHEPDSSPQQEWSDGDYVPQTFSDLLQYSSRSRQCIESEKDDEGSWHWVSASLLLPRHLSVTSQGRRLEDAIARLERQLNILYHQGGEAAQILGNLGWPDIPTVFARLKKDVKI